MKSTSGGLKVIGPIEHTECPERRAYVVERPETQPARACIITASGHTDLPGSRVTEIAQMLWQSVAAQYESFPAPYVVILELIEEASETRYTGAVWLVRDRAGTAEDMAASILSEHASPLSVNGESHFLQWLPSEVGSEYARAHLLGPDSFHELYARKGLSNDEISDAVSVVGQSAAAEVHATLWFHDFRSALYGDDLETAFVAFIRFVQYWRRSEHVRTPPIELDPTEISPGAMPVSEVIAFGGALWDGLLDCSWGDYAEFVAVDIAKVAEENHQRTSAALCWRQAGIAAEFCGDLDAVTHHYGQALSLLDDSAPPIERARILMSYGTSLVACTLHWEFTSCDEDGARARGRLLDSAEQLLSTARGLYTAIATDNAAWAVRAIDLDLARILDARGDHASALSALRALPAAGFDLRLALTAVLYEIEALLKLSLPTPDAFIEAIQLGNAMLASAPKESFPSHRAMLALFSAMAYSWAGQHDDAIRSLRQALNLQWAQAAGLIRPPEPGRTRGGLQAIDLAGLLQNMIALECWAREARDTGAQEAHETRLLGRDAFLAADRNKSRWFARDLLFRTIGEMDRGGLLQVEKDRLRNMVAKFDLDHRVVLTTYDWFLKRYGGDRERAAAHDLRRHSASAVDEGIAAALPEGSSTIVVSFYAAEDQTFAYLLSEPEGRDQLVYVMHVSRREVDLAAADLQTGVNGNGRMPPIDPANPNARARYFKRFEAIIPKLEDLAGHLRGADVIMLSLHGSWHDLPVESILLRTLWREGRRPSVIAIPSLGVLGSLVRRDAVDRPPPRAGIGLLTAWAADDRVEDFSSAHDQLCQLFAATGRPFTPAIGPAATGDAFLAQCSSAGYVHVLAHGLVGSDGDAMKACLLLSGQAGPRAYDDPVDPACTAAVLMASGATASHLTLQACSLGRLRRAFGDELWGFGRAALAAGADSVLAPIWEINPRSSTFLLNRFYERWFVDRQPRWRALADAQYEMWSLPTQPAWSHLYHWGAFRLTGLKKETIQEATSSATPLTEKK